MTEPVGSGLRPFRWLREQDGDPESVLRRLLQESAAAVPGLSSDPSLTDPLVRLLLQAMSREYSRLYGMLDDVVGMAYRRIVEQLLSFPRAPRPSSTVLRLRVKDPGVLVHDGFRVIGRKALAGPNGPEETNIGFVPLREEAVAGLGGVALLVEHPDGRVQRLQEGNEGLEAKPAPNVSWTCPESGMTRVHIGLDLPSGEVPEVVPLYLRCSDAIRDCLMWSRWSTGTDQAVVPGQLERMGPWHQAPEGEVLRTRADRTIPVSPHDRNFVHLDTSFIQSGRSNALAAVDAGISAGHLPSMPQRCWMYVDVEGLDQGASLDALGIYPDCVVAFNCQPRTFVASGGTEPEQRVTLDTKYESIFRIDEVRDSANAVIFEPAETSEGLHSAHRYYMDMDKSQVAQLRLSGPQRVSKPRSFEIDLTTTLGSAADGLDPGSISVLHDRSQCPGVDEAVNVAPSRGGLDAESLPEHAEELRSALTSRGRAVTHHDFDRLTKNFDPQRVHAVHVKPGVTRDVSGVVRCVDVHVQCASGAIRSEAQRQSFESSLQDYLQVRATAGLAVRVRAAVAAEANS